MRLKVGSQEGLVDRKADASCMSIGDGGEVVVVVWEFPLQGINVLMTSMCFLCCDDVVLVAESFVTLKFGYGSGSSCVL